MDYYHRDDKIKIIEGRRGRQVVKPPPKPVFKPPPKPVFKPPPKPVFKPPRKPVFKQPPKPVFKPPRKPVFKPPRKPVFKPPRKINFNKVKNFAKNAIKNNLNKIGKWIKQKLDPCKKYQNEISDLDKVISNRNAMIANLNNEISVSKDYLTRCTNRNNIIVDKNNALLNTLQYFKDLLFGTNNSDGYIKTILNANIAKDKIQNQTISGYVKEGIRNKARPAAPRPAAPRPAAPRPAAPRSGKARPAAPRPGKARPGKSRPGKSRPGKSRPGKARPGKSRSAGKKKTGNKNKGICSAILRRIDDRKNQIANKNKEILNLSYQNSILNDYKNKCYSNNNNLMQKNNALLDTSQFYDKQTNKYDKMLIKMNTDKTKLLNKKLSDNINREGFNSGYKTVTNENTIIQNQINLNKQKHSIDNQLYVNLYNRIQSLDSLNQILSVCLFVLIIISGVIIWISDKSLTHKLVMVKVVWLYVIIVEIIEYVLFYVFRYLRALFYGQPYNISDFWKFPELSWMDICILILIALSVFI